ncbi:uncharacterized protein PAC_09617 [Phialocephala subalpina]|uniref:Uncharacterized protein n=1 Tax=Phialocephala subalpina TaxID=576137 RepID=A0A1L7X3W9_9HELO|nr:uncharacterized protein PAC_09617 [Phialocephala subalpina]
MDGEDESGGLFNIEVGSDEEREAIAREERVPRDFQSEENFQQVLKTWRPKVETGEIWRSLKLPLDNPSKPDSQTILHAVEELYFLKRYEEALKITETALKGELIEEFRGVLVGYRGRCEAKLATLGKQT